MRLHLLFLFLFFISGMNMYAQRANVCNLEILDVFTGDRNVVRKFYDLIEAPNWTSDGKYLVYNSKGKLYKLNIASPNEILEIPSSYVDKCNNDHVISFDNEYIALSHHTKEDKKSRIYVIPFSGGEPKLITPLGESYLHGWSPDGDFLSYCANRNGNFDVYVIPSSGGKERRLTTAEGLDDGPEYAPDGKTIWFNSVRSGLMQIWKMNSDGSDQKQMTFDEDYNSWFPHVSPDGKWVVYLAYNKSDLKPSEHLPDKNVVLRIISVDGGAPKTLLSLFGGQGTINVNSWSPDSRKIAFVSYEK